jgi:polyisoprenoid-binding protein YceI
MNAIRNKIFLILLVFLPFAGIAQTQYRVKSHDVTIEGTSNLQSWTADVKDVNGTIEFIIKDNEIREITDARFQINSRSIEGSEGRRMNSKIYESLEVEKHPQIRFDLREVRSIAENPGRFHINARGVLTVAGESKVIEMRPTARILPNGDVEITGNQEVLMSDFGISPPTALLGALRTGDQVNIVYKLVLTK